MANTRTATRGVQSPPGSFFGSASNGGANGGFGVIAAGGNSVSGVGGFGIEATAGSGFPNGYAGAFNGNVSVSGNLSKTSGSFKIDHPLDPTNKYLYHSFVESPDMMNIYNGNVVLDANGEAVVGLPDWFGALNRDFRYQLTCIGGFAPVYMPRKSRTTSSRSRGIFTALNAVAVVLRFETSKCHNPFVHAPKTYFLRTATKPFRWRRTTTTTYLRRRAVDNRDSRSQRERLSPTAETGLPHTLGGAACRWSCFG